MTPAQANLLNRDKIQHGAQLAASTVIDGGTSAEYVAALRQIAARSQTPERFG
ncbi:MAG: hypothetical protein WAN48_05375 [Actinomycetes bacterium]